MLSTGLWRATPLWEGKVCKIPGVFNMKDIMELMNSCLLEKRGFINAYQLCCWLKCLGFSWGFFEGDFSKHLGVRKGVTAEELKKGVNICRYEAAQLPGDLLLSSSVQRSMRLASKYLSWRARTEMWTCKRRWYNHQSTV